MRDTDPKARFERKYEVDETTGCWLWTGAVNGNGWPIFTVRGRAEMAHRFSYETFVGSIDGGEVQRTCGVILCVRPVHFLLVPGDPVERFWTNVEKGDDGHWRWTPASFIFRVGKESYSPRRFAYEVMNGEPPEGKLYVMCGVKVCVKPEHAGNARDKFWAKVDKAPDGCWYWTGSKLPTGYPHLIYEGKSAYAHRLAYVWAGGTLETGAVLTQTCGHKDCVKPTHQEQISYKVMVKRRRKLTPEEQRRATDKAARTRQKREEVA